LDDERVASGAEQVSPQLPSEGWSVADTPHAKHVRLSPVAPRMPTETPDASKPPAHRDKTAMNGPQLLIAQHDSSGLMTGPPAVYFGWV
jgi:hypothetical protein